LNGSAFVPGSVVKWNGTNRATSFISSGQLQATIPATDVELGGTATVTVFNPGPGGGTSAGQPFTINNPAPTLASIAPTSALAGGAQFTLTVNGSSFVPGSVVRWNCGDSNCNRTTTFVDPNQLTATIPAADLATAGTASVTVFNPTPAGGTSGAQTFTVNNPVPTVASLNPTSTLAGGMQFTLTVDGTNFVTASVVRWNGSDRPTTFVNSGQVTAMISAADIATGSTASVTVFNPAPGGGTSGAQTFTVNNPLPTLTSVVSNPNPIPVGAGGATLTVNGSGFVPSSVVRWGGSNRTTIFVSPTQLTATIPASDLVNAGSTPVTVFNPAPAGGTSSGQNVAVASPVITSLSPSNTPATSPQFTLTVNGNNFHSGSVVRWKGSPLPTTFVNSSQLTALVDSSLVAGPGTAQVTVINSSGTGGISDPSVFSIANRSPLPTITGLMPSGVKSGGQSFTLAVFGSNFINSSPTNRSVVHWNGNPRTTMFVSSMELWADIPASDIVNPDTANITVVTPAPGGGTSNTFSLPIQNMVNPVPATTSLVPDNIIAGTERNTLTVVVNGSNFVPGAVVRWNGANRTTMFVNAGQLQALIPASDLVSAGSAAVTVFNPAPGGGTSSARMFTISNPAPMLSSISPNSVVQGSPGFTLTVVGANFVPGSVVQLNGSNRMTTFIGTNQLRAAIPASDVSTAGSPLVRVVTPAPGGGMSGTLPLNITSNLIIESGPSSAPGTASVPLSGSGETGSSIGGGVPEVGAAPVSVRSESAPARGSIPRSSVLVIASIPVVSRVEASDPAVEGGEVALKVYGRSFLPGAVVRWNGKDLETTYVGPGELRAALPSTLASDGDSGNVTVINPGPNGVESYPLEVDRR
jgi:hypothetical protein